MVRFDFATYGQQEHSNQTVVVFPFVISTFSTQSLSMFEALWKSLVIASGGWFSIGSILLVLLLLSLDEGLKKAWAYILGYGVSYLVFSFLPAQHLKRLARILTAAYPK